MTKGSRAYVSIDSAEGAASRASERESPARSSRTEFTNLVNQGYDVLIKYYPFLSPLDQDILRWYYVYGMSQHGIATVMGWVQAAVSRRLKSVFDRIKFLVKRPSNNPIEVRAELSELFPENLFEFAYFFYWELTQNRVKLFIETSQSGAANKLTRLLVYLDEESARIEKSNQEDPEILRRLYLVNTYRSYYRFIRERSNILSFLYKKNDGLRSEAHYEGPDITSDTESKEMIESEKVA